jgi:hypothetical protein
LSTLLVAAACLTLIVIDCQNLAEISSRDKDSQRIKSETDELISTRGGSTNLIRPSQPGKE